MEDCYYFLYSKCSRGENCKFRHCYSSKENPVLCKNWEKKGRCTFNCPFRHSDYHLKKARVDEMCYWEATTGCTKEFCEFRHKDASRDEWKSTKVKTLTEIKLQKEKQKSGQNVDNQTASNDDRYLAEIDKEIDEIDDLLDE